MGSYENEVVVSEMDFQPEAEMFNIWVSNKTRPSTKDGMAITVRYWEGCWDIPEVARDKDDVRRRPQVTASSTISQEDAEEKCRQKVFRFWMTRSDGLKAETHQKENKYLTREQRRATYTIQSFLEEWFASRTNPNTAASNRWATNTTGRNKTILTKWIYPYLGGVPLTSITHEQVRIHFTETLPSVLDDNDQRVLGDRRIRGIYSVFKTGMNSAGAKGLVESGEYLKIGIQMSFEPAGITEDIDEIMWTMNDLLKTDQAINDPLALRWGLAYGQALRRGERCGLRWSDINFRSGKMRIQRQMNYTSGQGDYLDERLKANEARNIDITPITLPILLAARARRDELEKRPDWNPRPEFADLVLLRESGEAAGSPEKLNHDNELFHEFLGKYGVQYANLAPGSLRHASATYHANYGGADGRGASREMLRMFMGHSPKSVLDAYYVRSSDEAMSREFGATGTDVPRNPNT